MPEARRSHGFTLIEAMTVVVIVGVLAVLATVAYRKWVRSAYIGEANDMIGNIRAAEESFRAENTIYYQVSPDLSYPNLYPTGATPNALTKVAWGAPCTTCDKSNPNAWVTLGVQPSGTVRFGYAVIAGSGSSPGSIIVDGVSKDLSSMQGQPWFVAEAICDLDGQGKPDTTVYGLSSTNQLLISYEGQ